MKATSELAALDPAELSERDFYAWTRQQARALSRLRGASRNLGIDPAHLTEEVRDLGNEQRYAVESQLERLIEHLLKLEYSELAEPRRLWVRSVDNARHEIERRLTPTLRRAVARRLATLSAHGRRQARPALLDHPEPEAAAAIPETCPWTLEQLLAEDWYPASRHGLPSPELP